MNHGYVALGLWLLASSATAAAPTVRPEALTGCWFSTGTQGAPDETVQGISHREADGSFSVRFAIIDGNGQVAHLTESGYWGVNASRYLTITTVVNGRPASFADIYDVLSLAADRVSYRRIGETTTLFQSERVPCDTLLPRKSN